MNATGGTGKASDVNFARLQAELDSISRENILRFATPPFFTIIIRSLTILEGVALDTDPSFKLVRGSYPYVLNQLLSSENGRLPDSLQKLLVRLLTVNGEGKLLSMNSLDLSVKILLSSHIMLTLRQQKKRLNGSVFGISYFLRNEPAKPTILRKMKVTILVLSRAELSPCLVVS